MTAQSVYSVCPHDCPDTCGAMTRVEDGRAVAFRADSDHEITRGWLCAKVNDYLAHAYHPDRFRYPLRRTGRKGSASGWARISWDQAIGEISQRWREIIHRYGAEAILPYSYSGTLGLVQMGICNTRFWNRLGAALTGEVSDPPVMSLYVFGANPVASSPNAALISEGLMREDLFTVVHELFMTDTADCADIVLPATSQLEHTDLHRGYGHTVLAYNQAAIPPLGECKSNWEALGLIASAMGFDEPWLHQSPDEIIEEMLTETARHAPELNGIDVERLKREGAVPLTLDDEVPYADLRFATPSGKVELYCESLAERFGIDPLPGWTESPDLAPPPDDQKGEDALELLSPAPHHFVSSSFANQAELRRREGAPALEIHPRDAKSRGIADGDRILVFNCRGSFELNARVSDNVLPGVAVTYKGYWAKHSGGRNVNWTTSDILADLAGQSTFHTNRVWVKKIEGRHTN